MPFPVVQQIQIGAEMLSNCSVANYSYFDDDSAATVVHATRVRRQPGRLLWQCLDRCAKEDDRQAAACSQRCGPNRLQYTQERWRAESVPARDGHET